LDQGVNIYGTTTNYPSSGAAFELKRTYGGWTLKTLWTFNGTDGDTPDSRLMFGPNGTLYGTTFYGGTQQSTCQQGCGTVYNLKPQPTPCKSVLCPWIETVLYSFSGRTDGGNPGADPVFDREGNLYGTTMFGSGLAELGVVFQLTPSNGGWTESVIHDFDLNDGAFPQSGVVLDNSGNVYGTTSLGGSYGEGDVYELSQSGSGWMLTTLYAFQNGSDGSTPFAAPIFDSAGNLYGTAHGGSQLGGVAFELTPSGGAWTYSVLYSIAGTHGGSVEGLAIDAAGNLYGETFRGGAYERGSVFKLTYSGGTWTYTSLHDFTGGQDGGDPVEGVTLDANGNIYGATEGGGMQNQVCGSEGCGVIFEITQ
jgi:uncharacterized repeat protein (TIGR03803 family)